MNTYHPLPGFLVITPLEETQYGSISIADNMSYKDSAGVVVAIGEPFVFREGDQAITIPCPVNVGDKIIYKNTVAQRFTGSDGKFVFLLKWHEDPVYCDIMSVLD